MLLIAALRKDTGLLLRAMSASTFAAWALVFWLRAYTAASATWLSVAFRAKSRNGLTTLSSLVAPSDAIAVRRTLGSGSFWATPRIVGMEALPPCRAKSLTAAL